MDAVRGEAAAAFAAAHGVQARWDVSRMRCAMYAVVCPILLLGISALALSGGIAGSSDAPTAAQREAEERAVAIVVYAIVGVIGLLASREFIVLAVCGGGLAAGPEGLSFTFGRRRMLFRWRDVAGATVEERTSGRGSYRTLAVRFVNGEYRWPRAFSLWFTEPDCLCLSPYILEDRATAVALGIEAALARWAREPVHAGTGAYTSAIGPGEERPRWITGIIAAIGLLLFAALCTWGAVEAATASDLGGVLRLTLMAVAMAVLGIALLVRGTAIREWWRHLDPPAR